MLPNTGCCVSAVMLWMIALFCCAVLIAYDVADFDFDFDDSDHKNPSKPLEKLCNIADPSGLNLAYNNYVVNFNITLMQANYVRYISTSGKNGCYPNPPNWKSCERKDCRWLNDSYGYDKLNCWDYVTGGLYDRGHLVPNADYGVDTFIISNAVPMKHDYNSGCWLVSENGIRRNYHGHIIYKGCDYSYGKYYLNKYNKKLYIPIGCYYVVVDNMQTDSIKILDYGYFEMRDDNRNCVKEKKLPYWIVCLA
jgi:DNA/RNA endonuclease G (NUC1)